MDELTSTSEETTTVEETAPDNEIVTLLREVLGRVQNMQQALEAQAPVEQAAEEVAPVEEALLEDQGPDTTGGTTEPSPDPEEVDKLLHED